MEILFNENFEELWNQIEQTFNFEPIYETMKALNFHWGSPDGTSFIPGVEMIKKIIKQKSFELTESEEIQANFGGFQMIYLADKNQLTILFVVEKSSAHISTEQD